MLEEWQSCDLNHTLLNHTTLSYAPQPDSLSCMVRTWEFPPNHPSFKTCSPQPNSFVTPYRDESGSKSNILPLIALRIEVFWQVVGLRALSFYKGKGRRGRRQYAYTVCPHTSSHPRCNQRQQDCHCMGIQIPNRTSSLLLPFVSKWSA